MGVVTLTSVLGGPLVALLLGVYPDQHAGERATQRPPQPDSVTVILLGTGMPYPDPKAQGPATAVVVGARIFLFDAGPGVVRQMTSAGLPVRGGPLTALFITHLHSDHTLGYPDLIFTSWVMGRKAPLRVYGPRGLQAMTDHLVAAYREDIVIRTGGLEHQTPDGYQVTVTEIRPGPVFDRDGVRVTAIAVPHGSWPEAYAYRLDAPGRSVVISGDTRPSEALVKASRGVDILIHEVYPEIRLSPKDPGEGGNWPAYMRAFHTSDRELGALAASISPRLLVLSHIVRMGGTDEELIAGIRAGGYRGKVVVGKDLDRY